MRETKVSAREETRREGNKNGQNYRPQFKLFVYFFVVVVVVVVVFVLFCFFLY